jgi:hypothetical protein
MAIIEKIAAAMKEVGYIKKDKKLEGGARYNYLSEEKITSELHAVFADLGIVVAPINMEILDNRTDTTRSGGMMYNTRIRATFRFSDGEDSLDVMTLGEGSDQGDKTLNKCMTAAFKYALRQVMLISTGNDPDDTPSAQSIAPAIPVAQSPVQTAATIYAKIMALLTEHGWTEPGEGGKLVPTKDGLGFIRSQGVPYMPSQWKDWIPEQFTQVVTAFEQINPFNNQ